MDLLTTKHFDEVIEVLETPPVTPETKLLAALIKNFRRSHQELIDLLLQLYDEASEHNIDVGREYIYNLAQRLGAETSPSEQEASPLVVAFVQGASWWEFTQSDATMWPADRDRAEAEAIARERAGILGIVQSK